MASFRRPDLATSFGFFPQPECPFQQNLRLINCMMTNLLVEIQNVVVKQLSRNLLIMLTAIRGETSSFVRTPEGPRRSVIQRSYSV